MNRHSSLRYLFVQIFIFIQIIVHSLFSQRATTFQPNNNSENTSSHQTVLTKVLTFTDDEFFNLNSSLLSSREEILLDMDFQGIVIQGPTKVVCEEKDILPLVIATRSSGERDWDISLITNCYLIASNIDNGEFFIAKSFSDPKKDKIISTEKDTKSVKPSGLPIAGAHVSSIDIRKQIPIPWNSGTWSLSCIYYNWVSNRIEVQIIGDSQKKQPDSLKQFEPYPVPKSNSEFPSFLNNSNTPVISGPGAVFTVEHSNAKGKKRINVFGSFSLPNRSYYHTKRKIMINIGSHLKKSVKAIVPATFLMFALDGKTPFKLDWHLPVFKDTLQKGDIIKGAFTIEAFSSEDVKVMKKFNYLCYLVIDGVIYGPKLLPNK